MMLRPRRRRRPACCSPARTGPGLIAAVSGFLADAGLNIVDADQHSSDEGRFFMRMAFDAGPEASARRSTGASRRRSPNRFEMDYRFAESSEPKRLAIMVSREDHCLSDLLWRWRSGELGADVVAVVSNHADHERAGRLARPPLPPRPGRGRRQGGGREAHPRAARRGRPARPRPLHAGPLGRLPRATSARPAINIHHSFLPAFVGADPYRRAHERGVKLIGATAHYVTEELDAGPIIDQDVTRVSHRDEVDDLKRIGRDIERLVLARAVTAHIDDRVLLDGARTIVF